MVLAFLAVLPLIPPLKVLQRSSHTYIPRLDFQAVEVLGIFTFLLIRSNSEYPANPHKYWVYETSNALGVKNTMIIEHF